MSRAVAAAELSSEDAAAFALLIKRSHGSPKIFIEKILRAKLRRWQLRACVELSRRILAGDRHLKVHIRSCHGSGKTWFAAALLLWWMCTRPDSRGLTTAPSWAGVENLLWPEIAKLYGQSLLRMLGFGRITQTELYLDEQTWFAVGASSDKPEKLEGHHSPTAVIRVIDEAKAVEPEVYTSTKGMLAAPRSLDLWISTPTLEAGDFYNRDINGGPDVYRVVVEIEELITDLSLDEETRQGFENYKAEAARDWGVDSPEYQSRVLARYISNVEGQLYPTGWVERAFELGVALSRVPPLAGQNPFEVLEQRAALDVAGSVDGDQNVCVAAELRNYGPALGRIWCLVSAAGWHERDTMRTKGRLLATMLDRGTYAATVDTVGLGKGVFDQAVLDFPAAKFVEYRSGDKPTEVDQNKARFVNRKAEDSWNLRTELLEKQRLAVMPGAVDKPEIFRAQFRAVKYEILQTGKRRVVDPADSPDYVDATLMCLAAPRVSYATSKGGWL
jgi:hypothetical protein